MERLKETNQRLTERVLSKQDRVILDFDSSVNTVFGNQEGAETGYTPMHPGKKSMHPLYIFDGNSRLCLHAKLCNGKAYTSTCMIEVVEKALKHVHSGTAIMACFGKGFSNERHLLYFEKYLHSNTAFPTEIPYTGKLKLYNNFVKKGLEKSRCHVYEGAKIIEWIEIEHQAQTWSKSRRVVLIRMAEASEFEEPYLSEEFI